MGVPQTKADLIEQLGQVQRGLSDTVQRLTAAQFNSVAGEGWSASGYLKHLLLSNKPFAKAMQLPPEQLERRFGLADHPSMTYTAV